MLPANRRYSVSNPSIVSIPGCRFAVMVVRCGPGVCAMTQVVLYLNACYCLDRCVVG